MNFNMVDLDEFLPHRLMTYIEDKQSKRYFKGKEEIGIMNFDMINYVLSITTEHITKLDILNTEKSVNLHKIIQKKAMKLNDTIIDISDYSYLAVLDYDVQDEIIFDFYTYQDMGDGGMDLIHETTITTKLSTLDSFQILWEEI